MTTLLKTAVERIQNLPQEDQDFYARQLLRGLEAQTNITRGRMSDEDFDALLQQGIRNAKTTYSPEEVEKQNRELGEVMDRMGQQAQANGWNDELDAALLRGDFDND